MILNDRANVQLLRFRWLTYDPVRRMKSVYVLLFLSLLLGSRATPYDERPPNIIIIFTDDQGYGDVGIFGAEAIETPHLDRMAQEGVRLTNFYVSSAVCSASRAALLTGSYHRRVDIDGALTPHSTRGLHPREVTIAELLKQKAYATAAIGKWHLGHYPEFLPPAHGFDTYFGIPYSNDMSPDPNNNPRERARKWPPLPLVHHLETIELEPDQSHLTHRYTEAAVAFIEANQNRPFFLYLAHTMPHVPLYASSPFIGTSAQGLYGDVIQEIDASVGEVLAALKRTGLDEQTLVIFTSDNGPWKVFGNHSGDCGPLRGNKGTSWECGVRVPFIARWPGQVPAGQINDAYAMTIDMLPTIARLTETTLPTHPIDGKDIWPLLTLETTASPHEALFFYYARQLQAIRYNHWKLHFPHRYRQVEQVGADGMPGTYIHPNIDLALYDLATDIGESVNVANQHPAVVAYLSQLADSVRQALGDKVLGIEGQGVRPAGTLEHVP